MRSATSFPSQAWGGRWIDTGRRTGRVKANPALSPIPIIAVTSYALSGDDVKAFEAGCDAYVTKPFSPRELLAKIREYLQ